MCSSDQGWGVGVHACLPVTVDDGGHGNPEIQGNTVSAGPTEKDHINNVKFV